MAHIYYVYSHNYNSLVCLCMRPCVFHMTVQIMGILSVMSYSCDTFGRVGACVRVCTGV